MTTICFPTGILGYVLSDSDTYAYCLGFVDGDLNRVYFNNSDISASNISLLFNDQTKLATKLNFVEINHDNGLGGIQSVSITNSVSETLGVGSYRLGTKLTNGGYVALYNTSGIDHTYISPSPLADDGLVIKSFVYTRTSSCTTINGVFLARPIVSNPIPKYPHSASTSTAFTRFSSQSGFIGSFIRNENFDIVGFCDSFGRNHLLVNDTNIASAIPVPNTSNTYYAIISNDIPIKCFREDEAPGAVINCISLETNFGIKLKLVINNDVYNTVPGVDYVPLNVFTMNRIPLTSNRQLNVDTTSIAGSLNNTSIFPVQFDFSLTSNIVQFKNVVLAPNTTTGFSPLPIIPGVADLNQHALAAKRVYHKSQVIMSIPSNASTAGQFAYISKDKLGSPGSQYAAYNGVKYGNFSNNNQTFNSDGFLLFSKNAGIADLFEIVYRKPLDDTDFNFDLIHVKSGLALTLCGAILYGPDYSHKNPFNNYTIFNCSANTANPNAGTPWYFKQTSSGSLIGISVLNVFSGGDTSELNISYAANNGVIGMTHSILSGTVVFTIVKQSSYVLALPTLDILHACTIGFHDTSDIKTLIARDQGLSNSIADQNNCFIALGEICPSHMNNTKCQSFCKSVNNNESASYNCDAWYQGFCAQESNEPTTTNLSTCACFEKDSFYQNYIMSAAAALPGLVFPNNNPECIFFPCANPNAPKPKAQSGDITTCGNFVQCINQVWNQIEPDGKVADNITIPSNECGNVLSDGKGLDIPTSTVDSNNNTIFYVIIISLLVIVISIGTAVYIKLRKT